MREYWVCEKCGEFRTDDKEECIEHEMTCGKMNVQVCHGCGKAGQWQQNDVMSDIAFHSINLGSMGYNSALDGCIVDFCLCDYCLVSMIKSFKLKDTILNSGVHRDEDKLINAYRDAGLV